MQQDQSLTLDRLTELQGTNVYDSTGDKIGTVEEIFYDDASRQPEWIGVGTGFFGTKRVLVPAASLQASSDGVVVPYDKAMVKDGPDIDGDEISEDTERELYAYYGLQRSERRSETGLPGGSDRQTGQANLDEQALTRSEEELRVGKREVESGQVRLRKWIETEPVEAQVELRRETMHIRREPLEGSPTGDLGPQEIEVVLHEQQPVVQKEVVGRERISVDRDVDVRQETVSDELRKERVEVEGDADLENRRRDPGA